MATAFRRQLMAWNDKYGSFPSEIANSLKLQWFKKSFRRWNYLEYDIPNHWILPQKLSPRLERKLNSMGLLYDDYVWNDQTGGPIVANGLKRLEPEVLEMRQRRVDRANDLNIKHLTIPEHLYNHQGKPLDPRNMYLTPIISQLYYEEWIHRDMKYKYE